MKKGPDVGDYRGDHCRNYTPNVIIDLSGLIWHHQLNTPYNCPATAFSLLFFKGFVWVLVYMFLLHKNHLALWCFPEFNKQQSGMAQCKAVTQKQSVSSSLLEKNQPFNCCSNNPSPPVVCADSVTARQKSNLHALCRINKYVFIEKV